MAAATLAACVEAGDCPDDICGVVTQETTVDTVDDCHPWHCGANGGIGEDIPFHQLHARGLQPTQLPDGTQISIERFDGPPTPTGRAALWLQVADDDLYGWRALYGWLPFYERLEGPALVGSRLILRRSGDNIPWVLQIDGVGSAGFWVGPSADRVPTYRFVFRREDEPDDKFRPLCPDRVENQWSGLQGQAVIFEGDLYDATTKTVSLQTWAEPDATWFNLSCAGTSPSKMHLLRHTTAGTDPTHSTDPDKRTAMLKMLTGDYCGTGHTFTINDQPLRYMTNAGWHIESLGAPDIGTLTIDAIWTQHGAVCIDYPRLSFRPGFETIFAEIASDCGGRIIPWCYPNRFDWQAHGHVISASPPGVTPALP